jgi:hypothetical protein
LSDSLRFAKIDDADVGGTATELNEVVEATIRIQDVAASREAICSSTSVVATGGDAKPPRSVGKFMPTSPDERIAPTTSFDNLPPGSLPVPASPMERITSSIPRSNDSGNEVVVAEVDKPRDILQKA